MPLPRAIGGIMSLLVLVVVVLQGACRIRSELKETTQRKSQRQYFDEK